MRASAVVALAWGVAFVITFLTRRFASAIGLLDEPNERSSHSTITPVGGGVGLVVGGSLAALLLPTRAELGIVLLLSLVIAAVSLRDDIRHVAAPVRFATQLVVTAGALLALGAFHTANPALAALALVAGVWWINLFNFMDGIDGIAGVQALFMLLAAASLAAWHQPHVTGVPEWAWMIAIAAAVVAFLQFNWPPATIFMGDVGSTWLAYVLFAMATISVRDGWLTIPTWLILGGVFIADSTTTLLRRMARADRWFAPHRSHAYQRLAMRWGSHRPVTLLVSAVNLLWLALLAYASLLWPQWAWFLTGLAYTPLIAASLSLGAGSASDPQPTVDRERCS